MSQASIHGSWTHSFEEDQGDVLVYRPTGSFAFPPSRRGRETLEFGEGGELIKREPGPDDRTRASAGRWTALGMNRVSLKDPAQPGGRVIEVVEVTPEILKIKNA